ncbi:GSCFA domain-containing protein [Sphingobium rhizovicinum]|uniref:GSCFA domain-containing protein n=1 Tax=Sphingobium rhizovicinum TaxID=432308 RepID=A0ABV7NDI7_9SPHN
MGKIFRPGTIVNRKISASDSIFTVGSCFAREVERSLNRKGFNALSLKGVGTIPASVDTGYVNRYNTYSILNELRWALGTPFPEEGFFQLPNGRYIDLHSHPVIPSGPIDQIRAYREGTIAYFRNMLSANVVTITLGLIEGWYDKKQENFINFAPIFGRSDEGSRNLLNDDRFEFRVISYEENMRNVEQIYELLTQANPKANIIVTVSPVTLSATFTPRDVVVANCLSKSMLRTVAESWVARHPEKLQYFPSYEMATLSDRSVVYKEDGMHIQREFVDQIMSYFSEKMVA